MSDQKHTPGPWGIERDENGIETTACGPVKARFNRNNAVMASEAEANARLIEAAPELLEALRELLNAAEIVDGSEIPEEYDTENLLACFASARTAIAKAEGLTSPAKA